MLFNVESDFGNRVTGYVVPDALNEIPRIRVVGDDGTEFVVAAEGVREALIASGRHTNGRCGFDITQDVVPFLGTSRALSIYDDATGLLVYRRLQPEMLPRKVLRIETRLFPFWRFDEVFSSSFQYFARGIELFGRETTTQMFVLNHVRSSYLSGRVQFKNYAYYIDAGFDVLILLQDPYVELAERLVLLARFGSAAPTFLGERDSARFAPVMAFATEFLLLEPARMKRALLEMPVEVELALADPLVRLLTTSQPDEMPTAQAISGALDVLANCAVVGLVKEASRFNEAVGTLLSTDPASLPLAPVFPQVDELAQVLREARVVDHLIARDLECYQYIDKAVAEVDRSIG